MATHVTFALLVASLAAASANYSDMCLRFDCPSVTETALLNIANTTERRMADTSNWATTTSLGNRRGMFRKLFRYIQGNNNEGLKMAMTVPVPRKFTELPAPSTEVEQTMSFFLSPNSFSNGPPEPSDMDVSLTTINAGKVYYVRSFTTEKPADFQGRRRGGRRGPQGGRRGQAGGQGGQGGQEGQGSEGGQGRQNRRGPPGPRPNGGQGGGQGRPNRRGPPRGQGGQGGMSQEATVTFMNRYDDNLTQLKADLTAAGLAFVGGVHYNAGYSAPWTWPKHEEVWVEKA